MGELKHGLRIMRTTFKCFSLRWTKSKSAFQRCWDSCGWGLKALKAYFNNWSIKGWSPSLNFQGKFIQTWWRCFSPTWSSKMTYCCQTSKESAWRSTKRLGNLWLDSNQGVCKWEREKQGLFQNSTTFNTMGNAWGIQLVRSRTSMLVVSRWIKGCLTWLSQESLFHVVEIIQHWTMDIWYSCTASNTTFKWIRSMCFMITCSRPRDSRILGCHMWFWCQNSLNTLELM